MFEESASSVPSLWLTVSSWFTPTVLFVLLNLMIGIIAISSSLNKNKHNDQRQEQHRHLGRYPSMLHRLKSINLYSYTSRDFSAALERPHEAACQEQPPQPLSTRSPSVLQRLKSINFYSVISQEPTFHAQKPEETKTLFSHDKLQEEERANYGHARAEEKNDENVLQGNDMTLDEVYMQLKSKKYNRTKSDTMPASGELPQKLPSKMRKSASTKSAFSHFEENDIVETRRPATVNEGTIEADEEVDSKADDFINRFKQQLKLQRIDSIMRYKELISRGTKKCG